MEEKKCSTCKKGLSLPQWSMLFLSFYILISAIYGTVKIIQDLYSMFY
jgi:hypothetical protein